MKKPFSSGRTRNDEFYTHYDGIEILFKDYFDTDKLRGREIYCNCDDYRYSNFVKFFKDNFKTLGLTRLIATNYDIGNGAFIYNYDGINEDVSQGIEDGSFENYAHLVNNKTVIITNPPFSLSRKYFNFLNSLKCDYAVINSILNIVKFNTVERLQKLDVCKTDKIIMFYCNYSEYENKDRQHVCSTSIVSTIPFKNKETKVNELKYKLDDLERIYEDTIKPIYKNVLHCKYSRNVPNDYDGLIAVPITFLIVNRDILNMFEIIDVSFFKGSFYRLIIKKKK